MKIAITSPIADPRDPKTWSQAPHNLICALERQGVEVTAIDSSLPGTAIKLGLAAWTGLKAMPPAAFPWTREARRIRGRIVERQARAAKVDLIVNCGTFDAPITGDIPHAIWLDNSFDLLQKSATPMPYPAGTSARIDAMEREVLNRADIVLPFSAHVAANMTGHYGVPSERVHAIGCGTGAVEPYAGRKDFAGGHMLFVAKHLFAAKGGELVLDAFDIIRKARPQTELVLVGTDDVCRRVAGRPGIRAYGFLPQDELNALYHDAAMLVQPMLSDPWGQVYIEAMKARAVVVALNVAALPELTENGTLAVLIDRPDPQLLADAVLATYSRSQDDLDGMTRAAQARVAALYNWDRVATNLITAVSACIPNIGHAAT